MVDASVLIEYVLRTPLADSIGTRFVEHDESLHAPHIIDLEVTQVIRRFVAREQIDSERGGLAIQNLTSLRITRYPHNELLPRIWQLRHNFTAYDAAYTALAEALDAPLLTRDAALASAQIHGAQIELI